MPLIKKVDLKEELKNNFLNYSEEVIRFRAIPDVRDGLKIVHRRILWSMWEMGCKSNSTFKKCARVVGDCFKYHPHGDVSLYDSLVRMAQPFNVGIPLITSQGNFGSPESSEDYASMRYTECKLSSFCEDVLFADIDFDAVDMIDNYSGEFKEPVILPARIPLILLTGPNGIAIGMKTDILPHNLKEVCSGLLAYLRNPDLTVKEIMRHIPAPDFPLGGCIVKNGELVNVYQTGNGLIQYKATAEEDGRSIVFTSIPYAKNKSDIIKHIAELVRDEKLEGISDIRDESEKYNIRICIDLKRTANYEKTLESIYKMTDLAKNFSFNVIAISNHKPRLLGILDIFKTFIDFRRDVIARRTKNQKEKAEKRKEIVDGVLLAVENPDEVLKIVRNSEEPVVKLKARFKMTDAQAQYVFNMPVKKFSKIDTGEVKEEQKKLDLFISEQISVLKSPEKVNDLIEKETKEISKKYSHERKTQIITDSK